VLVHDHPAGIGIRSRWSGNAANFATAVSTVYLPCGFTGNSYCNFRTPESGVWSAVLQRASAGSLTLTFANEVPTKALTPGIPVTATIKFQAQEAGYTFAATAGKNVTFNVTHFNFTSNGEPGKVFLAFYKPGSNPDTPGNSPNTEYAVDANTTCPSRRQSAAPGKSRWLTTRPSAVLRSN
jgi:hypothetical protein